MSKTRSGRPRSGRSNVFKFLPHDVRRKGVEWEEVSDLAAVAADVDVLYQVS